MIRLSKTVNRLLKQGLVLSLVIISAFICMGVVFKGSSYITEEGYFKEQPISFPHRTHVDELGMDCKFCHTQVEHSDTAGMPSMATCYGCHKEVLKDSEYLKPVRKSFENQMPLQWTRVNRLPDHVHFYHASHVNAGVACQTCHGDVEHMTLMSKKQDLTMQWCLECHKSTHAPKNVRLQDCYTCHR